MQDLLIIDGNAIVHRAFHAFPPLIDKNKQPVNAVYGFYSILLKALDIVKPTHLAICFDRPAPTFRKLLFSGYQAHRPKMADDLSEQMGILQETIIRIGIPIYSLDGFEADDVIGTIAVQSERNNYQVMVLTGDRDLLQLVNNNIKIISPIVGITKFILFDEMTVSEKYGVKPTQVTDYKALVGDASDGYPGVTGIGPKTAINLLKTYGNFDNLYNNLDNLPPKIALKLANDAEQAALAKKLASIDLQVPIHIDLSACDIQNVTRSKIEEVFDRYNFISLKKRLDFFEHKEQSNSMKKDTKEDSQLTLL